MKIKDVLWFYAQLSIYNSDGAINVTDSGSDNDSNTDL